MQDVGIRILVVGLLGRGTQSGQTSNCDQPDLNLPYDIFLKIHRNWLQHKPTCDHAYTLYNFWGHFQLKHVYYQHGLPELSNEHGKTVLYHRIGIDNTLKKMFIVQLPR